MPLPVRAQIEVGGDPRVDPDAFRITTFAGHLNYPVGMTALPDGSILVATSNGPRFFNSTSGSLIRLQDTDEDGVADRSEVLVDDVPGGRLTSVRRVDDLVFVIGSRSPITIYQLNGESAYSLAEVGRVTITYGEEGRQHPHSALAVRPTPGVSKSYDVVFQIGSASNHEASTDAAMLTSTISASGELLGDALYLLRVARRGRKLTGTDPVLIATGLRNAAGLAFHASTGDLYIAENGIDGIPPEPAGEAFSADELNVIPADVFGISVPDFGFPSNYVAYPSGEVVGTDGIAPLIAFLPVPYPDFEPEYVGESEGPNDLVFAPSGFPEGLNTGVFIGFHGQFNLSGPANEENPLVYADPTSGEYFHFVSTLLEGVGHLNGLLATEQSLFVADMSPSGAFADANENSGIIYQILASDSNEPPGGLELALEETSIKKSGQKTARVSWDPAAVATGTIERYYSEPGGSPVFAKSARNSGETSVRIEAAGDAFEIWICEQGSGPFGTCSNSVLATFGASAGGAAASSLAPAEEGLSEVARADDATGEQTDLVTLVGNYPNPFNPITFITFFVPTRTYARLSVHDILGREVAVLVDGVMGAGTHEAEFNGDTLPSGVYVYQLNTPIGHTARTMALMK